MKPYGERKMNKNLVRLEQYNPRNKLAVRYDVDRTWLWQKYVNEKMSLNKMAEILDISPPSVRNLMIRYNIPLRKQLKFRNRKRN